MAVLLMLIAATALSAHPVFLSVPSPAGEIASNGVGDIVYANGVLYVATGNGLSTSSDSGETFSTILDVPGFSGLTAGFGRVIAAASRDTVLNNDRANPYPLGGGFYIGAPGDWIHSIPTQATFTPDNPNPGNLAYDVVLFAAPAETTIYAPCFYGGLISSTDWGASWIQTLTDSADTQHYERLAHRHFSFAVDTFVSPPALWDGTAEGIFLSEDAGTSWTQFVSSDGLTGNWVVALAVQRLDDTTSALWAITKRAAGDDEFNGFSFTTDRGATWHSTAYYVNGWNFAFAGSTVFAATGAGVLRSDNCFTEPDSLVTWDTVTIYDDATGITLTDPEVVSLCVVGNRVFAGTNQGLAISIDGGESFSIIEATYPKPNDEQVYAYPSPFSPNKQGSCFIVFPMNDAGAVSVEIFDYALQPVRTLISNKYYDAAPKHRVQWDGYDDNGEYPGNGVYFVKVSTPSSTMWGKVMVIR